MYSECAEKQMFLFLNSQTGSSDYIRKSNPTGVLSQFTKHTHALNVLLCTHMHARTTTDYSDVFQVLCRVPFWTKILKKRKKKNSLFAVRRPKWWMDGKKKLRQIILQNQEKVFGYKFIFLRYDRDLLHCLAATISLTQCWPTMHKHDLSEKLRKMNRNQTSNITGKEKIHRNTHVPQSSQLGIQSRHRADPPPPSQVERACDHTAGRRGETVGGTEVKIKQTIRVSTAASHSKHESSSLDK